MDLRLFHFDVVKYANQKKEQRKEMLQASVQEERKEKCVNYGLSCRIKFEQHQESPEYA